MIGTSGIKLIKKFEGLKLEAYQDSVGVWTIGYGTTRINGHPIIPEMIISPQEAEELLLKHCLYLEEKILFSLKQFDIDVLPREIGAFLSFSYNVGLSAFIRSTMHKLYTVKAPKDVVSNEFLRWNKAGGIVLEGLTKRRQEEKNLFLFGDENE